MAEEKLIDFVEKRKESIEKKRRSFERVLFQNILGSYGVISDSTGSSITPIEMVDISYDGLLFQVPYGPHAGDQKHDRGSELTIRMYFTKYSFVPAVIKIKYANEYIGKNGQVFMRYGCEFDKTLPSFEAVHSFIEFLYKFAEHSSEDKGDARVFFL